MESSFYTYYLRRPDREDPLEPGQGCPFYVGKGNNSRKDIHRCEAKQLQHKSGRKSYKINIIHKLWKAGLDFKEDIILDNLTEQEAFEIEREAIAFYGRKDNRTGILTNLTDGGDGVSGVIRVISEEHKQKISEALKGRPGCRKGIETKRKMSEALKGRLFSEEHRRKIGEAKKGRPGCRKGKTHSEETKRKMSEALKGHPGYWKGKTRSEETRRKMDEAKKRYYVEKRLQIGRFWPLPRIPRISKPFKVDPQ